MNYLEMILIIQTEKQKVFDIKQVMMKVNNRIRLII